jgi:FtsP/CotA-like multicopper oxidase with cupredoxin domain
MPTATSPTHFAGDYYEIAVRQKQQQILPAGLFPATTVWAFGPNASSATSADFSTPALPIEATVGTPVRVKWINDLKDSLGHFNTYPPTVPIDQAKHWANPTGLCDGDHVTPPDCAGTTHDPYTGPVPMIVHLHGAHDRSDSDGIPEAWYLPAGAGAVEAYTRGSDWNQTPGVPKQDGAAVFDYPNDQPATLLFFHDHTLGVTAQNVYMGMVGPYLLRGGVNDLTNGDLPEAPYEIPLVIQDKSFNTDGSLLFADEGNTVVVNGKTWPFLNVEPRRYRFRIVIGTDSQYFNLSWATTGRKTLNFTQIGNDGGFLPQPVMLRHLNLTPGERADVVVDFSAFAGKTVVLQSGGDVMQVNVGTHVTGIDNTVDFSTQSNFKLPSEAPICPVVNGIETACETNKRSVSIVDSLLGTVVGSGTNATAIPMVWDAATTENPTCGNAGCASAPAVEVWDIYDFEGDSHPMHLHEVRYEVLGRIDIANSAVATPPAPGEGGRKDTTLAHGGQILRIRVKFDLAGLYAWHCHIISHEDDEMMRAMCISDPANPVPCNAH